MLRQGVKAVPVVNERRRVVGIITGGDLLTRAALEFRLSIQQGFEAEAVARELHRLEIDGKTASDVMTPNPRTISADATLVTAIRTMADRHVKRLPVDQCHDRHCQHQAVVQHVGQVITSQIRIILPSG